MYPILDKAHAATGQAINSIMTRSRNQAAAAASSQNSGQQIALNLQQENTNTNSNQYKIKKLEPIAFGGDAQLVASKPIGFHVPSQAGQPNPSNDASSTGTNQLSHAESDPGLYQGNAWDLMYFQRLMVVSLLRLLIFIRKVYEDFLATEKYRMAGHSGFFIVSALTMFAPTIVFTTYRICRYLQQALPKLRNKTAPQAPRLLRSIHQETDVDGLVTARQTPVSLSISPVSPSPVSGDYHEVTNEIKIGPTSIRITNSTRSLPTSSSKIEDEPIVDIEKLGHLPDPESTRIVIGIGEQIVHGVLYIFWQLKRQVDVVGYLVERACLWRKAKPEEIREFEQLRTGSDGLEWFQDFYAAFLAIILQIYSLGLNWTSTPEKDLLTRTRIYEGTVNGEPVFRVPTQIASQLSADAIVMTEIVVSSLAMVSLLLAVRRKDDGSMTMGLSMLGWGSIFGARVIIISLGFVHLGWKLMLTSILVHLFLITAWIYKIAIDSHNDRISETSAFIWQQQQTEDEATSPALTNNNSESSRNKSNTTSQWLLIEHATLIAQISTLFAIPSLFYWPIMFNLRLHCRPLKYLVIILAENLVLILGVVLTIGQSNTSSEQWYLLCATGALTITGFIFISLYVCCKPSLTEYFVRADQQFNGAEQAGIYFELCSRVFKMPDLSNHAFTRLLNQSEV